MKVLDLTHGRRRMLSRDGQRLGRNGQGRARLNPMDPQLPARAGPPDECGKLRPKQNPGSGRNRGNQGHIVVKVHGNCKPPEKPAFSAHFGAVTR